MEESFRCLNLKIDLHGDRYLRTAVNNSKVLYSKHSHTHFYLSNSATYKISDSVVILSSSYNAGIAQLVEQRIRNA